MPTRDDTELFPEQKRPKRGHIKLTTPDGRTIEVDGDDPTNYQNLVVAARSLFEQTPPKTYGEGLASGRYAPLPRMPSNIPTWMRREIEQPATGGGAEGPGVRGPAPLYPTDIERRHDVQMREAGTVLAGGTARQGYVEGLREERARPAVSPIPRALAGEAILARLATPDAAYPARLEAMDRRAGLRGWTPPATRYEQLEALLPQYEQEARRAAEAGDTTQWELTHQNIANIEREMASLRSAGRALLAPEAPTATAQAAPVAAAPPPPAPAAPPAGEQQRQQLQSQRVQLEPQHAAAMASGNVAEQDRIEAELLAVGDKMVGLERQVPPPPAAVAPAVPSQLATAGVALMGEPAAAAQPPAQRMQERPAPARQVFRGDAEDRRQAALVTAEDRRQAGYGAGAELMGVPVRTREDIAREKEARELAEYESKRDEARAYQEGKEERKAETDRADEALKAVTATGDTVAIRTHLDPLWQAYEKGDRTPSVVAGLGFTPTLIRRFGMEKTAEMIRKAPPIRSSDKHGEWGMTTTQIIGSAVEALYGREVVGGKIVGGIKEKVTELVWNPKTKKNEPHTRTHTPEEMKKELERAYKEYHDRMATAKVPEDVIKDAWTVALLGDPKFLALAKQFHPEWVVVGPQGKTTEPEAPAPTPTAAPPSKPLTDEDAEKLLQETGGNKERARALARERGYTW